MEELSKILMRLLPEYVIIAIHAFMEYKTQFLLSMIGIIIGIFTISTMVAIINGLNRAFDQQISSLGAQSLYVSKFPWLMTEEPWAYQKRKNITWRQFQQLKNRLLGTFILIPQLTVNLPLTRGREKMKSVRVIATDENYFQGSSSGKIRQGRSIIKTDRETNKAVTVIGTEIADKLFPSCNPLGERISVDGRVYKIIGIMEKQGTFFGQNNDQAIVVPITTVLKQVGPHQSLDIQVTYPANCPFEQAEREITTMMRRVRGLKPNVREDFAINRQDMLKHAYQSLTGSIYAAGILIALISIMVGGINIMNTILMSVKQRTREIGIRKAFGATEGGIILQFVIESVLICICGGVIGIGASRCFEYWLESQLPVQFTVFNLLLSVGCSALVGLFFGIFPAFQAAKCDPVESLRYE